MSSRKRPESKKQPSKAPGNLVAALAVIGIVIIAVTDLFSVNDVPGFIYIGLIGSALGAKFDEIFTIGGKR